MRRRAANDLIICDNNNICVACLEFFDGSSSADSSSDADEILSDIDLSQGSHEHQDTCIDTDNSNTSLNQDSNFNLNLGDKGIRFGFWNINYLTDSKFEQIKLLLCGCGKSQVDILLSLRRFSNLMFQVVYLISLAFRFSAKIEQPKVAVVC